jgi:uncharacterized protein (TIGR02391 family)
MDNIKNILDERLWNFIKRNYNSENYSNAVLDSIQFVGDLIRDKSALETDGVNLIGQAFGGKNPKIQLNKLQTETEQNIQKGIEQTLRGIYTAFRNPRSHTKFQDPQEDADAIIIFINHLLKLIDKSKGRFTIDSFIARVTDSDFVNNDKYADLIIGTIPSKKHFDVLYELYKSKDDININNLRTVFHKLLKKITEDENNEIIETVSDELRTTTSDRTVMQNAALFESSWTQIAEDAKLRAENKLLNCLKAASYNNDNVNGAGIFSSWLTGIIEQLSLKDEFRRIIYEKLSSKDKLQQRYVIEYFSLYLEVLHKPPFYDLADIIKKELSEGNNMIYNYAKTHITQKDLQKEIAEEMKKFQDEKAALDDLPF